MTMCTRYNIIVGGFLLVLRFPPPLKLTIEILLKVALDAMTLILNRLKLSI